MKGATAELYGIWMYICHSGNVYGDKISRAPMGWPLSTKWAQEHLKEYTKENRRPHKGWEVRKTMTGLSRCRQRFTLRYKEMTETAIESRVLEASGKPRRRRRRFDSER